jgi:hypothetical protein
LAAPSADPFAKNKTFLFADGEQKYQRRAIPFIGLVPSVAMRTGDFSNDAFGNPVTGLAIVNPNIIAASADPTAFPNVYFQCDSAGNPLASKPDGSQAQGTPCNKIPAGLINNIGQAMMNVYPAPNANAGSASTGYNYVNEPVRTLDETKFDARLDHTLSAKDNLFGRFSYDQAFSFVPGGAPGLAESNAFGSNERIINHARNIAIGETHGFSASMINQASLGYNRIFDHIASQGNGTCASANLVAGGIPGANLGSPVVPAFLAPIAADWSRQSWPAATGQSAIAATLRSRVERTSTLSETLSNSSVTSMTSGWGLTSATTK